LAPRPKRLIARPRGGVLASACTPLVDGEFKPAVYDDNLVTKCTVADHWDFLALPKSTSSGHPGDCGDCCAGSQDKSTCSGHPGDCGDCCAGSQHKEHNSARRAAYARKVAQVRLTPCAHIAAMAVKSLSGIASPLPEHHAILDVYAAEVIHFSCHSDTQERKIVFDTLAVFSEKFPNWRIVELPASAESAQEVLDRTRARSGEEGYGILWNNCEHFATECFAGCGKSKQLWSAGANVASSAKGGVVAGISAAGATTTVTTPYYPWYFLGVIKWGTTTASIPLMSTAAAAGIGLGVFAGSIVLGLGTSYAFNKWVESNNAAVAEYLPMAVYNRSDGEIVASISNLDSSFASLGDLSHDVYAFCGVGQRKLILGSGLAGELNPPADDATYHKFMLNIFVKDADSSLPNMWPSWKEVACIEVERGDVLEYTEGCITHVRDPESST